MYFVCVCLTNVFLYVSELRAKMQETEHLYEAFLKRQNIFKEVQNYVQCDDKTFLCNELMK